MHKSRLFFFAFGFALLGCESSVSNDGDTSEVCSMARPDWIDWSVGLPYGVAFRNGMSAEDFETASKMSKGNFETTVTGVVLENESPDRLVIDACPPGERVHSSCCFADCISMKVSLSFVTQSGDFEHQIPPGTLVKISVRVGLGGYPPQAPYAVLAATVENVDNWEGWVNPTEPGSRLWFAVASATNKITLPSGLTVTLEDDCSNVDPFYRRWLLALGAPGKTTLVPMGEIGSISNEGVSFDLKNVNSDTDMVEGAWGPSYLVRRQGSASQ